MKLNVITIDPPQIPMERNKPVHLRSWVTSCTWYSPVEWLGSTNHVSCHMHTEEQSDIHNFVLSDTENIFVSLRFPWELLLNPPVPPSLPPSVPPSLLFYFSPLMLPLFSNSTGVHKLTVLILIRPLLLGLYISKIPPSFSVFIVGIDNFR